jgi:hypothetical protein
VTGRGPAGMRIATSVPQRSIQRNTSTHQLPSTASKLNAVLEDRTSLATPPTSPAPAASCPAQKNCATVAVVNPREWPCDADRIPARSLLRPCCCDPVTCYRAKLIPLIFFFLRPLTSFRAKGPRGSASLSAKE